MPINRVSTELAAKIRQPAMSAFRELWTVAAKMGALGHDGVHEHIGLNDITMGVGVIFEKSGDQVTASLIISEIDAATVLRADVCFEAHIEIEAPEKSFHSLAAVEAFDAQEAIDEFLRIAGPVFRACLDRLKAES